MFSIALQAVENDVEVYQGGTIFNKMTQVLAYADDVLIIGMSLLSFKKAFLKVDEHSRKIELGMKIKPK